MSESLIIARIRWKLRYFYLKIFHTNKKNRFFYPSVRHAKKRYASKSPVKQYLTKVSNPTAGIGDQLASCITGIYYSQYFSLDFAYSMLYPESWNDFLGFREGEEEVSQLICSGYKVVRLPYFEEKNPEDIDLIKRVIASYQGEKVLFFMENNNVYTAQCGVEKYIKEKFRNAPARKQENLIYSTNEISIAVHIRRGDITVGQKTGQEDLTMRWLNNSYYIQILRQLIKLINKPYKIYLFSQGIEEDFKEFGEFDNLIFCLTTGAQETFLHLVMADILIISKSSFSYKPALLSNGIKVCPRHFWHEYPDREDWIVVDEKDIKLIANKYFVKWLKKFGEVKIK